MRRVQDVDVLTGDPQGRPRSALRLSLAVAIAVVVADQLTKTWALNTLGRGPCSDPDACIDLIFGARFNLVFNTGAAFTRGSGLGPFIGLLAIVMTGVLLYLSTRRPDRFGVVLFGAMAGGAAGNLLDRIFRADDGPLSGAVVDFIDLGWWPVFNVADMAIVVGVVAIIGHAFIVGEPTVADSEPSSDLDDDTGIDNGRGTDTDTGIDNDTGADIDIDTGTDDPNVAEAVDREVDDPDPDLGSPQPADRPE